MQATLLCRTKCIDTRFQIIPQFMELWANIDSSFDLVKYLPLSSIRLCLNLIISQGVYRTSLSGLGWISSRQASYSQSCHSYRCQMKAEGPRTGCAMDMLQVLTPYGSPFGLHLAPTIMHQWHAVFLYG